MKLRINSKTLNRHFKEDALNIHYIIQTHQHTHCDAPKEFYRGKSAQIPASSQHSQPNMEYCLLNSYRHHPILLSFHRRSITRANQISRGEEIGEGLAASHRACFSFSCSSFTCTLPHTQTHICIRKHTLSETHTHARGQERELPWETEAWVKEGCWQ